ncbi:MAG: hypothetical protein HY791_37780 [Deltaproteobacteria bacterium]|nr:hypothetical protein [Deltaproteobacteria bacterium]
MNRLALLSLALLVACGPTPSEEAPCEDVYMTLPPSGSGLVLNCAGTEALLINPEKEVADLAIESTTFFGEAETYSSAFQAFRITTLNEEPGNELLAYLQFRDLDPSGVPSTTVRQTIDIHVQIVGADEPIRPKIVVYDIDSQWDEENFPDPTKPVTVYDQIFLGADIAGLQPEEVAFSWGLVGSTNPRMNIKIGEESGSSIDRWECTPEMAAKNRCARYQPLGLGKVQIELRAARLSDSETYSARIVFDVVETAFVMTPDEVLPAEKVRATAVDVWDGKPVKEWKWALMNVGEVSPHPWKWEHAEVVREGPVAEFQIPGRYNGISLQMTFDDGSRSLVEHMFRY